MVIGQEGYGGRRGSSESRFSVVIPLNDERDNVAALLDELHASLATLGEHELIVVDDGSTDGTAEAVRRHGYRGGNLRLLQHETRRGQSTAVYNGARVASAELVVILDGDLQNEPADIRRLLAAFHTDPDREHLGLVIGHRTSRRDNVLRRLSSRVANSVRRVVLGDSTPDSGCGLKLIRRSVLMQLPYFDHMHRFLPALVLRAGFRVRTVPVGHRPRLHGRPHYGLWDRLWVGVIDMFGVAWLAHRTRPLDYREERVGP